MKRSFFLLAAVLVLAGFGLYNEYIRNWHEVSGTFYAMGGIPVHVKAWHVTRSQFRRTLADVRTQFEDLEQEMSVYRAGSFINRINQQAAAAPVAVPPDTWRLLTQAKSIWRASGGLFDPTVGPLVDLWREAGKRNKPPTDEELVNVRARVGMDRVELLPDGHSVHFLVRGMRLDLGAIAKGYMCDRAVSVMRKRGILRGLVEAGGDVVVFDDMPDSTPFSIAVRNPDGSVPLRKIRLVNGAVMTSGSYERYTVIQGVKYSHILNPVSGRPAQRCRSVTIVGHGGAETDAWATACAVRVSENLPVEGFLPSGFRLVNAVENTGKTQSY